MQQKKCTKSQINRSIQINLKQNELRTEARERLLSEEGVKLRKKRCTEPESVFGQIKWNSGFKRFSKPYYKQMCCHPGFVVPFLEHRRVDLL